jgi:hypothetical protein
MAKKAAGAKSTKKAAGTKSEKKAAGAKSVKKAAGTKPARPKTPAAKAPAKKKPAAKPRPAKAAAKPERKGPAKAAAPAPKPAPKAGGAAAGGSPTLYALVVGCDLYLPNTLPEGTYPSLSGCVRDATRVEEFLRQRAGLIDANLIRLTSTAGPDGKPVEPPERRPTYENIVNGFRGLTSRAKAGDHLYVHYSGHGGQCPTLLPKVKGPQATDETLVPIDIGNKTARYVRDVEIAKLLKEMTDKGLVVTVVFDCCHSGGATRAVRRPDDPTGIRGVDFVDKTKRPTDSLVGTLEELAAAVPAADATRGPGAPRGVAPAGAAAAGLVFLAACRPFELAREFMFDGGPSQGALTYWYLKLTGAGVGGLTFRTIIDQVVKRIHDQFPDQTPMLFGDPDRAILGGAVTAAAPAIPVTAVSGSSVTLGAGQAALVEAGTEYAVYPSTATDLTAPAERAAAVRVTAVRPNDATAELTQTFQSRGVRAGDRAVPIGVPLRLVRRVDVLRRDGSPPGKDDEPLRRVVEALSGQTWVEPAVKPGPPADFVVTTDKKGAAYQICDASDVPLDIRPPLSTSDPSAARQVVARLVHLARYQAVQALDNPDPASPLRGQVVTELLRTPPNFQRGQPTHELKPYPPGAVPQLKPGEWVVLSVTNRSAQPVNFTVLDLSSDWSVGVIDLDGQRSFAVEPRGNPFLLPLQAALAEGQAKGSDVLKVVATVDPPPAFDLLALPVLDRPIPRSSERGGATRSAGPLAALLAAAGADRPPTRAMTTGGTPTRGWSVNQVKLEVG